MTDDRTIEQGPDPQPDATPPPAGPPDAPTVARAAQPSDAPGALAHEASVEPIATAGTPTAPVAVSPVQRPSRARWAVAALVALVVVALSAAGLFTLVGASSNAVVASWTPADALVYVEVRGDLPGDQRQNLGRFLAHFPGFADQATLDAKLDETLDKIVNKASDNKHDWTREIKPWFGGQVAVSVSSLPTPSSDGSGAGADSPRTLLVVTQKDPAAAIAWLKSLALGPTTDETYKGVVLTIYSSDAGTKAAATATGGVLLVGDEASVKAALDRNGKDGLAASKAFTSAMAGISDDQVIRTYVDLKAYIDAMGKLTDSLGGAGSMLDKTMLAKLPAWVAFGGRIESDALVSDAVLPVVASAPKLDDHVSTIAGRLPASTVVLLEVHQFDKLFAAQLDQLRSNPSTADTLKQVDEAAATLGGLDHLVGWIGDVGVVMTSDGATPGGGLVIVPTDAAAADKVVIELRNLVALAGSSSGITTRDEAYGAGTITTIDFGDVSKLTGGGAALDLPLTGHAELSYTVQGGVVIVGAGPTWVKSIVDVKAGSSLADQARYKDAIGRVEARNASSLFVDLAAVRKLAEPLIAKLPGSNYATEIKPYVQPFDVFVLSGWTDGEANRARYVLTVTNP